MVREQDGTCPNLSGAGNGGEKVGIVSGEKFVDSCGFADTDNGCVDVDFGSVVADDVDFTACCDVVELSISGTSDSPAGYACYEVGGFQGWENERPIARCNRIIKCQIARSHILERDFLSGEGRSGYSSGITSNPLDEQGFTIEQ